MSQKKNLPAYKRPKPAPLASKQPDLGQVTSPAVRNLLTQLAMAQGTSGSGASSSMSNTNTATSATATSAPSTSRSTSGKGKKDKTNEKVEKSSRSTNSTNTSSARTKGPSVAARMSKKQFVPGQRNTESSTARGHGGASPAAPNMEFKPFFLEEKPKRTRTTSHNISNRPVPSPQKNVAMSNQFQQMGPKIPSDVMEDLSFRFLLNIPEDEQRNEIRICFQIELALWFYLDYYCKDEDRPDCKEIGMREFTRQMFAHCDFLEAYANQVDQVVEMWRQYKSSVPTYGAIMLDSSLNHVLLVQGYYAKHSWGFPKGKVNESEDPQKCAVREVMEETSYDFSHHNPNGSGPKIQKFVGDTMIRLYIVPDVPADFPFEPKTRCEIKKIQWFSVWDLPTDKFDRSATQNANRFYTVYPFIQELQAWIRREQSRRARLASKGSKGPQGKVANIRNQEKERHSAFTPVVPKTANEKMNSAMDLLKNTGSPSGSNSSPRSSNEKKPKSQTDSLFRPVGNEQLAFSGHSFLQMWTGGGGLASSGVSSLPSSVAHPTPLKPNTEKPVYEAPKEEKMPRKKMKSTSSGGKGTNTDQPSTSKVITSAAEMEAEIHRLLGTGSLAEEPLDHDTDSSQDTIGKGYGEKDNNTDTGSTSSVIMANELPLSAAIVAAEKAAAVAAAQHHQSQQLVLQQQLVSGAHNTVLHQFQQQVAAHQAVAMAHQSAAAAVAAHAHHVNTTSASGGSSVRSAYPAYTQPPPPLPQNKPRSRRVSYMSEQGAQGGSTVHSPYSNLASPPYEFGVFGSQPMLAQIMTPPTNGIGLVQLCEAWKDFRFDTSAIMAAIS